MSPAVAAVDMLNRIDWCRLLLNLRAHGGISTREAARRVGCHVGSLQNLLSPNGMAAVSRSAAPRSLRVRLELLDLHYDHCEPWHTVEGLT